MDFTLRDFIKIDGKYHQATFVIENNKIVEKYIDGELQEELPELGVEE